MRRAGRELTEFCLGVLDGVVRPVLVPKQQGTRSVSGANALPSLSTNVDVALHHPRREQRLAFVLGQHLLFVAPRAQHQEAERPQYGDDHQGQENVLPAVVCEGEERRGLSPRATDVLLGLGRHSNDGAQV